MMSAASYKDALGKVLRNPLRAAYGVSAKPLFRVMPAFAHDECGVKAEHILDKACAYPTRAAVRCVIILCRVAPPSIRLFYL